MNGDRQATVEPIAIVGIGCRFPGGIAGPTAFWRYLCDGSVAVRDVPPDRWNAERHFAADTSRPGKSYVQRGCFLEQPLDGFDASFFGMSPREAARLDPQQRLLLEVSWEAFEDAGIRALDLRGSDTGVFVGGFLIDHAHTMVGGANRSLIDVHTASGSSLTMLAARLSHTFDLRGPALSIDTACSSSLVAIHYACLSLAAGESQIALVGGVNVMLNPDFFVTLCKAGMLAPDGTSKAFDTRANGYGRGEGAAIVVLCPLDVARRLELDVYAVIRGTAVNQDGYTPDGIAVPNPVGKRHVMRRALARAQVRASEIGYIEAHGTGTPAGDPIEVRSIAAILGSPQQRDAPAWLGSVKANIGHLEGAAGIAGLIKAALCVRYGQIPPQAQLRDISRALGLDQSPLLIPRRLERWTTSGGPRVAAVNAFGFGGTNAHAVLSECPASPCRSPVDDHTAPRAELLALSAKTGPALSAFARDLADDLRNAATSPQLGDLAATLSRRRDTHDVRTAIVADSVDEFVDRLEQLATTAPRAGAVSGGRAARRPRVAFVYTGMGPQWPAMGRELMRQEPGFARVIERLDAEFRDFGGFSPLEAWLSDDAVRMSATQVAQTTNLMLQLALTELWRSWGIQPDAVVGHSVGEVAAAHVCGGLSLADAVRVAYHRSRVQALVAGQGGMLAVTAAAEQVALWLQDFAGLSIAAINAPEATTVAGSTVPLTSFATWLQQQGVAFTPLRVEIPYHSAVLEPLRGELLESLSVVRPRVTDVPFYSAVSGTHLGAALFDADYWWQNMRQPVQFAAAARAMMNDELKLFIEIGPHPVLAPALRSVAAAGGCDVVLTHSLQRGIPERRSLLSAGAELYQAGVDLDWSRLTTNDGTLVRFPRYPWQRQSLWSESPLSLAERCGPLGRPCLGQRLGAPRPVWESDLDVEGCAFVFDHRIGNTAVFPAAGYVEALLDAAEDLLGATSPVRLEELRFDRVLALDGAAPHCLRIEFDAESRRLTATAPTDSERLAWSQHASARLAAATADERQTAAPAPVVSGPCGDELLVDDFYAQLERRGYTYGPSFQGVERLQRRGTVVCARIVAPPLIAGQLGQHRFHPALLDACLHSMLALLPQDPIVPDRRTYLPVEIAQLEWYGPPSTVLHCEAWVQLQDDDSFTGSLVVRDAAEQVVLVARGVKARAVQLGRDDAAGEVDALTFEWEKWTPSTEEADGTQHAWLLLGRRDASLAMTAGALAAQRVNSVCLSIADPWPLDEADWSVRLDAGRAFAGPLAGIVVELVDRVDGARSECDELGERCGRAVAELNALCRAIASATTKIGHPRLYLLTRGSVRVENEHELVDPSGAALWGLGRVAYHELGEFHPTLIDLPRQMDVETATALVRVLLSGTEEEELALRESDWFVHRVDRIDLDQVAPSWQMRPLDQDGNWSWVASGGRGEPQPTAVPQPLAACGERYVELTAAVAWPAPTDAAGQPPGRRAAFLGVGREVEAPQRNVLVAGRFAAERRIAVDADSLAPLPPHVALTEVARALPWLPASLLWQRLIPVRAGMLIWMVRPNTPFARQLMLAASRWGARVVVFGPTAPTSASATCELSLAEPLAQQNPPDVVVLCDGVDPLDWDRLLAPDGWFVDAREDGATPLDERPSTRQTHRRLRFGPMALVDWPALRLVEHVAAARAVANTVPADAINHDAALLSFDPQPKNCLVQQRPRLPGEMTFVITGGLGGLGLATAEWLIARGVQHLVLLGRNTALDQGRERAVRALRERGAYVDLVRCDVRSYGELVRALDWVRAHRRPIGGVVHAASDPVVPGERGLMQHADAELLTSLMAAKLQGAWNLHRATQQDPIELFLLYSSIAALFGMAGAAHYVAANAFLDGLAGYRRGRGLPGVSVQWGAVADVGVLLRHPELAEHNDALGLRPLPIRRLLAALDQILATDATVVSLTRIDWPTFAAAHPASAIAPRCSRLPAAAIARERRFAARTSIATLRSMPAAERRDAVIQQTREAIAHLTDSALESIAHDLPLAQLGFDSLTTVELQIELQRRIGLRTPLVGLLHGATVESLAELLCEQLSATSTFVAARSV